jgi:hypothetical protein
MERLDPKEKWLVSIDECLTICFQGDEGFEGLPGPQGDLFISA